MISTTTSSPTHATDGSDYPRRSYAWTVVAILIATAILSYTDRQILSLLVDPIRGELGITDQQVSYLLGAAFAVVYGVAGIPLGFLADRTSRRNLIFAGVVVWSGGTVACGLSHSFEQLFAARIVVGLGEAVLSPAAISMISDYFPPSHRGTAVGCFLAGIAMGIGAAILIGGGVLHLVETGVLAGTALGSLAPWRLVLLLIGVPGVLWGLVILLIREPLRPVAPNEVGSTVGRDSRHMDADEAPPATATATATSSMGPILRSPTGTALASPPGTALPSPASTALPSPTGTALPSPAGTALPSPADTALRSPAWMRVTPIYIVVALASLVDNAVGAWAPSLLIRDFSQDDRGAGYHPPILALLAARAARVRSIDSVSSKVTTASP